MGQKKIRQKNGTEDLRLSDLTAVVETYHRLLSGGSLNDIYRDANLNITKRSLKTSHARLTETFGQNFWVLAGGGTTACVNDKPEIKTIIDHIERAIRNFSVAREVTGTPNEIKPVVRIGASLEFLRCWIFESVRRFRLVPGTDQAFEVDLDWDLPQKLRHDGLDLGKYDFVISSVSSGDAKSHASELFVQAKLEACLMFDRRFDFDKFFETKRRELKSVGRNESEFLKQPYCELKQIPEDLISSMTLVVQHDRYPRPDAPESLTTKVRRIKSTEHYINAYATVLCSGGAIEQPICCIGFPQLLPEQERARFRSLRVTDLGAIDIGVFRSQKARDLQPVSHRNACDALQKYLHDDFRGISNIGSTVRSILTMFPEMWNVSHRDKGDARWLKTAFKHVVIAPDGYFRGDHYVQISDEEHSFTISGRVSCNPAADGSEKYHLVWRGSDRRQDTGHERDLSGEVYGASVFTDSHELEAADHIIGLWFGRSSEGKGYKPDLGFLILFKDGQGSAEQCHTIIASLHTIDHSNREYLARLVSGGLDNPLGIGY